MQIRIAVVLLSTAAVTLGVAKALRVAHEHHMNLPLCSPFFISLLPAVGLTFLAFLSLFMGEAQVRTASIVIVLSMAITSLVMPAVAIPLAISLVGVILLNLIQSRKGNHAG